MGLVLRKDDVALGSEALNYFFQAPDGDALMCVLGFGMMYNHGSGANANLNYAIRRTKSLSSVDPLLRDMDTAKICVVFEAARNIASDEELLINYSETWWQQK